MVGLEGKFGDGINLGMLCWSKASNVVPHDHISVQGNLLVEISIGLCWFVIRLWCQDNLALVFNMGA